MPQKKKKNLKISFGDDSGAVFQASEVSAQMELLESTFEATPSNALQICETDRQTDRQKGL